MKNLLLFLLLFFVGCSQDNLNLSQKNISINNIKQKNTALYYDKKLMNACENLSEQACYDIGNIAYKNKDYSFALEAYDRACHYKFHIPSCRVIAKMFEGGIGVDKNLNNSIEIYSTACFRGDKQSCDDMKRLENIQK